MKRYKRGDRQTDSRSMLIVHRHRLVACLEAMAVRSNLADIRQQVDALQRELAADSPGPLQSDLNADNRLEIRPDYLERQMQQIAAARTLERAVYYVERLVRSLTEVKTNGVNDINLYRWQEYDDIYTDSLWIEKRRDSTGVHRADYWGNFIPQIPYQMMSRFTRRGEWVLDPFAGTGTTLIEGQRLGRNALGVELQPRVAEQARRLIAAEPNVHGVVTHVEVADSTGIDYRRLLQSVGQTSVQLVILHPPYHDIIRFSDDPRDLSNAESVAAFLDKMADVVAAAGQVLDADRHLVLVIGDKNVDGEWIPLGFLTMQRIQQQGYRLKSIITKNFEDTTGKRAQKALWRYRALVGGFYIFKHEYIFLLQKEPVVGGQS